MLSTWLKWLIPAPVATGTLCLTMYLTNHSKVMLDSLTPLTIQNKPDVKENEIKPETLKVSGSGGGGTGGGSGQDAGSGADNSDGSGGNSGDEKTDSGSSDSTQPQEGGQDSQSESADTPPTSDASNQDASDPSASQQSQADGDDATAEEIDLAALIKQLIGGIDQRQATWTSGKQGLFSVYDMMTTINNLNNALKQYKIEITKTQTQS